MTNKVADRMGLLHTESAFQILVRDFSVSRYTIYN
jgi:hypothetical protein